jgi:hypothetical protein
MQGQVLADFEYVKPTLGQAFKQEVEKYGINHVVTYSKKEKVELNWKATLDYYRVKYQNAVALTADDIGKKIIKYKPWDLLNGNQDYSYIDDVFILSDIQFKQNDETERVKKCKFCEMKKNHGLLLCGKCKLVYYCSKNHQRGDWSVHKKNCRQYTIKSMTVQSIKDNEKDLILLTGYECDYWCLSNEKIIFTILDLLKHEHP